MDFETIILLAFIAYLVTLAITVYSGKTSKPQTQTVFVPIQGQLNPQTVIQPTPLKPKLYKHTLTVSSSLLRIGGLLKQLKENGIDYTLIHRPNAPSTITFTAPMKLQNVDELKKKGIVENVEIEEVTGET